MEITIKEKTYQLNFGIQFLRQLDAEHYVEQQGVRVGMGLNLVMPSLVAGDAVQLAEVLFYATWNNSPRPSQRDIDAFLEDENTDIDKLFHEVFIELQKSNITKTTVKKFKKILPKEDQLK